MDFYSNNALKDAANILRNHYADSVEKARDSLRALVQEAASAVHAAEGSIMAPSTDKKNLSFIVSMNEELDQGKVEIPFETSFSGYVYHSGQMVAKIKPMGEYVGKIEEITGVKTEHYLALPISDEGVIKGVATFVNRSEKFVDSPYTSNDILLAQQFADMYSIGLRAYQRAIMNSQWVNGKLAAHVTLEGYEGQPGLSEEDYEKHLFADELLNAAEDLSVGRVDLIKQFARLLSEENEYEHDAGLDE